MEPDRQHLGICFDQPFLGMAWVSSDGRFGAVNDCLCAILRYPREELLALTWGELACSEEPEESSVFWRNIRSENLEDGPLGLNLLRKNGEVLPVLAAAQRAGPETEAPGCLIISVLDVTRQKRLEEALQESEERYRCISEAVTDYIFTVRVEKGVPVSTIHGPACKAVTGYSAEEFAADSFLWFRMVVEEDRGAVRQHAEEILAGQETRPLEHRIVRKDGAVRWISNTPVLHFDDRGSLLSYDGLIRDITGRKHAEQEREKLIADLQAALAKIKTLSGLLPICASCKRIRDDKGYWNQIESYIHEHSEADFSHSICPDCAKQLYPSVFKK